MTVEAVDEPAPGLVRARLGNGLRIIIRPQPSVAVASVAVSYGVGFRHEQPGQAGFAHLFEHLMTQGSRSLDKVEHKRLIEAAGGWYSGQTRHDYTGYVVTVPSGAVDLALFCEADRMAGLRITQASLANQVDVVEEEIRGAIWSRAYGGFPWFQADAALFETWANGHDGYGDMDDLRRVTVDDAEAFFERWYGPDNAVVSVAGGVVIEEVLATAERYFASIPARSRPERAAVDEPAPARPRWRTETDHIATEPAIALGLRVPSPSADLPGYLRTRLAMAHLAQPATGPWWRTLVDGGAAHQVEAYLGSMSDSFGTAHPASVAIGIRLRAGIAARDAVEALDAATHRWLDELDEEALAACVRSSTTTLRRGTAPCWVRAEIAATTEIVHGDAALVDRIPGIWAETEASSFRSLVDHVFLGPSRAIVDIQPVARQA